MAAISPPLATRASVASTPGPPALVIILSRGPLGKRGCFANTSAKLNSSEMRLTRITPQRRNAASRTSSLPAIAPV